MKRDEIVTALRCCAEPGRDCEEDCPMNEISREPCREVLAPAAADLIENQQRHIEALMKANDSLKDAIARRDKQIEDMKQGMAQLAKAVAVKEEVERWKICCKTSPAGCGSCWACTVSSG